MTICLINGSPKKDGSCSEYLVQTIEERLSEACQVRRVRIPAGWKEKEAEFPWAELGEAERVVLVFPLYVDGIPSHLLEFLERWEERGRGKRPAVYAVINCGFYEGCQNGIALDMVRLFCESAGFSYQYGIGIGGGPFIGETQKMPWSAPPKREVDQALSQLAAELSRDATVEEGGAKVPAAGDETASVSQREHRHRSQTDNQYVEPGIPRFLYLAAANLQWWKPVKKNGGTLRGMLVKKTVDMV